jgi:hypothetical protein
MGMTETFEHQGQTWRRIPAKPVTRFVVGIDLGQTIDSTAVAVIEHSVQPLETWAPAPAKSSNYYSILRQDTETRFDVRHLERLPLGTSYPSQVQHVVELMSRPPLRGCDLVVDQTGVGAAVADLFDRTALKPVRVIISAGFDAVHHGKNKWSVPKTEIISALDARLNTQELRFAATLRESEAMREELKDFRRHLTSAGRATYTARAGAHDDLVLAVGIALWWITKPKRAELSVHYGVPGTF